MYGEFDMINACVCVVFSLLECSGAIADQLCDPVVSWCYFFHVQSEGSKPRMVWGRQSTPLSSKGQRCRWCCRLEQAAALLAVGVF
jgi:hypothetical protein